MEVRQESRDGLPQSGLEGTQRDFWLVLHLLGKL